MSEKVSLFDLAVENAKEFLDYGQLENNSLRYKHVKAILKYGIEENRISVGKVPTEIVDLVHKLFGVEEDSKFTIVGR